VKVRIDQLLVERELAPSRSRAQALIMAGVVFIGGERIDKAGAKVQSDADVDVRSNPNPYVSRGGLKLAGALDHFGLSPAGCVCMDVGASTGGFTDCLLQRGATHVYAVDVGYGQLAWRLRTDERVTNLERTNIRSLPAGALQTPVSFCVADCSFISLSKVLPHVVPTLAERSNLVVLVKPQFEVGRDRVGKGGVVRDEQVRAEAIDGIAQMARRLGFRVEAGVDSEVHGPKGNVEHLLWLVWPAT
jgi:23S rRNA (cytidine1920-2'-O)/16S rRNA (cytidine1409-2'-O)-methyltransferase